MKSLKLISRRGQAASSGITNCKATSYHKGLDSRHSVEIQRDPTVKALMAKDDTRISEIERRAAGVVL